MNAINHQQGFVLVMVLLFLLAISLLIANNLDNSSLENKMVHFQNNRAILFEAAESGLINVQIQLKGETPVTIPSKAHTHTQMQLIHTDSCGRKQYHINSTAIYQSSSLTLESFFQTAPTSKKCPPQADDNKRIFWQNMQG